MLPSLGTMMELGVVKIQSMMVFGSMECEKAKCNGKDN
jgi:hypothetical protein